MKKYLKDSIEKTVKTPIITNEVIKHTHRKLDKTKSDYTEAFESLMANVSRPGIIHTVNYLASGQLVATVEDWKEGGRIFRYLKGTADLSFTFRALGENLEAVTDASFCDNAKSILTCRYVIRLFGDCISWRNHKRELSQLSTCVGLNKS